MSGVELNELVELDILDVLVECVEEGDAMVEDGRLDVKDE